MLQLGRGMQCNALSTWLLHRSVLQVRRNQRLLVLVVVSPHEGVMFPERRPSGWGGEALGNAQPIKDGLVSTMALHPRCAVDALEGLAGCWSKC